MPVNSPEFTCLVKVRSQRAERRLEYLRKLRAELAENPLLQGFGYDLNDLRQPLRVVPYNKNAAEHEARQRESFRESMSALAQDGEAGSIYRYRGGGLSEAKPDTTPRLLDDKLQPEQLVLLGDPGMGKTEWLKKQAYDAARVAYDDLDGKKRRIDDIRLPVFARLPQIAEALADKTERLTGFLADNGCTATKLTALTDADRFAAALLKALWQTGLVADRCAPEMWRWLTAKDWHKDSALSRLYLDSLDEVTTGDKDLLACLAAYYQKYQPSLYLTSRLVGYTEVKIAVKPSFDGAGLELELRPLERADRNQFIGQFFRRAAKTGQELIAELDNKPMISGMGENPLMLTLICLAFDPQGKERLTMPASRGQVYETVLRRLLKRWAANDPALATSVPDSVITGMMNLLEALAYDKFPAEIIPDSYLTDFIWDKEDAYINRLQPTHPLNIWLNENRANLQEVLYRTGALTRLGATDSYAFLHFTFQEYLTARACAKSRARVDQALTRIYDPKWHEVLILLGGEL